MRQLIVTILFLASGLVTDVQAAEQPDGFEGLSFLNGTWSAKVEGSSRGAVSTSGAYTFRPELDGHVIARHSSEDAGCSAPADFDCAHGDLLYIFRESGTAAVNAIYFDNEGHVIHYQVIVPAPNKVTFQSVGETPGPKFRLTYELMGETMFGKFQVLLPGAAEWKSYLEWSGKRIN
jgi:hypothetical protein